MGRTIPSYRIILEEELKRWERFQDFLRIDEREIFEDMMDECRRHASAAGAGAFPSKTEGMILSILFAHQKALKEIQDKIERFNRLPARLGGMSK
nr:hypothetical protein [Candidatus Njordarchaeum guaymaensis]